MLFLDFIKSFFGVDQQTVYLNQQAIVTQETQLAVEAFAVTAAINLVASAVSKCEFRTYATDKEIRGEDYYTWNIEPNENQNSSQFLQELVSKLLYYKECLVVEINGNLIIADSFIQDEYATRENYFSQVTRGTMNFKQTFRMSEVLYFRLNHTDVRAVLSQLLAGYNNLLNMSINKYKRSGGRKGILDVTATATGDKKFQETFDNLMNNQFKSYFEAENAVLPMRNGYTYTEQGAGGAKPANSEIVDIAALTKEAFERVAQAFKISPALLRGDIADTAVAMDTFLTFGLDPICDMISEEINRKRYGKKAFLAGNYVSIDTTTVKHIDIFAVATSVDKLIACGMFNIDELRRKLGDHAINEPFSKKYWMTKNYSDVKALEGGGMT